MHAWRAVCGRRCVAIVGAGLLVAVSFCLRGWAEPDWHRPSLDEFTVRVDEGADEEAAFHKKFYRATRIEKSDIAAAREIYNELLAERPGTAYLYYKLAHLDAREQNLEACIEHFKTALEHDPYFRATYDDLGRLYNFWGRDDELIELGEQAIEHIKPDNIEYYLTVGELHQRHDRTDKAVEVYERAIAEHPVLYRPWLKLFEVRLDSGDEAKAYETFRDALEATGGHRALLVGVRELYLEKRNAARAFELTELLIERFPLKADFWFDYVAALLAKGETAKARAAFEKSCAYLRGENEYFARIVHLYSARGDVDEAIAVFERGLEWEPESVELLVALGVLYQARGDEDKARAMHNRLLEVESSSDLALLAIAESYERQGDIEAFGEWAQRAVDSTPDSFAARFALLRYYERAGKRDEEDKLLGEILDSLLGGPETNAVPCLSICTHYLERERYDRVRDIASKALGVSRDAPVVARLYMLSGLADYAQHRIPDAARKFGIAVRRDFALAEASFYLGMCEQRLGRVESAISSMQRAVVQSPEWPRWRIKLGRALQLAGREDEAREQLDEAIKALEVAAGSSPDDLDARLALAMALSEIGRTEQAVGEFRRALELDPNSATALNDLGYMWAQQGKNLDEALKLIQRALEIEPKSGAITDSLGWVYFQQGRYKDALRELERAVDLGPPSAEIYDHVGDVHLKLGDKAKAIEWWNKALELYPEDPAPIRKKVVEHGGEPAVE